jgi:hypothetical protein
MTDLIKIVMFILISYSFVFVILFKNPWVVLPYRWFISLVGLEKSLVCTFCTGFWVGLLGSVINIFLFPEYSLSPSLVVFGQPEGLWAWTHIAIDSFVTAPLIFMIDELVNKHLPVSAEEEEGEENKELLLD